jgi:hypothetical protein
MRRNLQLLMVLILLWGWSQGGSAQEANGQTALTPVMAVEALGGNKAQVPGWQPALGQGISEMLIESLERSDNRFQVLKAPEATSQQSDPNRANPILRPAKRNPPTAVRPVPGIVTPAARPVRISRFAVR